MTAELGVAFPREEPKRIRTARGKAIEKDGMLKEYCPTLNNDHLLLKTETVNHNTEMRVSEDCRAVLLNVP